MILRNTPTKNPKITEESWKIGEKKKRIKTNLEKSVYAPDVRARLKKPARVTMLTKYRRLKKEKTKYQRRCNRGVTTFVTRPPVRFVRTYPATHCPRSAPSNDSVATSFLVAPSCGRYVSSMRIIYRVFDNARERVEDISKLNKRVHYCLIIFAITN